MSRDRDALITAYRVMNNCTHFEAEHVVRAVELAFAETFHKDALNALDATDGEHLAATAEYREQIRVLTGMLEAFPEKHMRFGVLQKDGTIQQCEACADWCYACTIDRLQRRIDELENQRD